MAGIGSAQMDRSGRNQDFFGMQNGSMQYSNAMQNWQSEPVDQDQPRLTTDFRFRPQIDPDKKLDLGTVLFIKKSVNVSAHEIYSLTTLRYLLRNAKEQTVQQQRAAQKNDECPTAQPFPPAKRVRVTPYTETFLSTMESFFNTIEFAGVSYGSPTPHAANGSLQTSMSVLSVKNQIVPTVTDGHAFFPNYFNKDIRNGQELYMIIKPIEAQYASRFLSPYGDSKSSSLGQNDLVIDIQFYTNSSGRPPLAISSIDALKLITSGSQPQQPPLESSTYIDVVKNGKDYDYELKQGLVYSIGKSLHDYPMRPMYMSTAGQGLPPEMQSGITTSMIEIALKIRRLY